MDSKFKCVCSDYFLNADITIYDFLNTKRRIKVTQEENRVFKHGESAYRQVNRKCRIHIRMPIRSIQWEVWFGQHFRSYIYFMSLNFHMVF